MAGPRRTVDEHAAHLAELLAPVLSRREVERVPLADALGRVLADAVVSPRPLPPFRNSQMDGYAGRAVELAAVPVVLPVSGTVPAAGGKPSVLPAGSLMKVMTGAPLPDGADAVVPVERTEAVGSGVRVLVPPAAGEFVRPAGSDAAAGAELVAAGALLEPRHLAAAAAAGAGAVPVLRPIRVAVLATGAEVVPPGAPLRFGEVHDVNGTALSALVRAAGADPVVVRLTSDDPTAFRRALDQAVAVADVVITAGGISRGDFEVVRQVLEPLGADIREVAMQPGGPQGTAVVGGVPIVCFPGNPVSAQVSFTVLLRPLLRAAAGLPAIPPRPLRLAAAVERSPAGRRQWLRGVADGDSVRPVGGPGSHLVATMAAAAVLIDVPADVTSLPAGSEVPVLPL